MLRCRGSPSKPSPWRLPVSLCVEAGPAQQSCPAACKRDATHPHATAGSAAIYSSPAAAPPGRCHAAPPPCERQTATARRHALGSTAARPAARPRRPCRPPAIGCLQSVGVCAIEHWAAQCLQRGRTRGGGGSCKAPAHDGSTVAEQDATVACLALSAGVPLAAAGRRCLRTRCGRCTLVVHGHEHGSRGGGPQAAAAAAASRAAEPLAVGADRSEAYYWRLRSSWAGGGARRAADGRGRVCKCPAEPPERPSGLPNNSRLRISAAWSTPETSSVVLS